MRTVSVTVMALALVAPALATDHPQEARKLSLRDRPGSSSLSWSGRSPEALSLYESLARERSLGEAEEQRLTHNVETLRAELEKR